MSAFAILMFLLPSQATEEADVEKLIQRANEAASANKYAAAEKLVGQAIARQPKQAVLYYQRGRYRFQASQIKDSLADFDRYVKLAPNRASRQWERGITCYYAGAFKKGAAQFELYQTYHSNDVENSVWRFLCMVPTDGVKKARKVMLPITNDRRLAMMNVYEMYRGKLKPADVLKAIAAAPAEQISDEARQAGYFYAYLYIGLYEEVLGHKQAARKYIEKAADRGFAKNARVNTYMWDVARIHLERMKNTSSPKDGKKKATKQATEK